MGAVFIVEQLSTGKQRALKIMAPELAADPETRDRFVLEARAAANIESDHVVEIVTAGVDEETGAPFLVMELLRGEELADAMERHARLPIGDVSEVLAQVGHALEQAHHQGIVHRDLKPENIFLATPRRRDAIFTAKVLDFGIAKLVEENQKTGTQPLGTPLYMAPEQTDRKGKIVPQTDVWALGLMAFFMLTGRHYWTQVDGSLPQLLREICIDDLPPASERAVELGVAELVPPGFDGWFARCVARDVESRFADAGEATRAFVRDVSPPDATAQVLVVEGLEPGTLRGASGALSSALSVENAATLPHLGAAAEAPRDGSGTAPPAAVDAAAPSKPAAGATMASTTTSASTTQHLAGPTRSSGSTKVWIAGGVAVAVVAALGGFYLGFGGDAGTDSATGEGTTAATSSAPTVASASAPVRVSPTGPCPPNMIFHPAGKMIMGARDASPDASVTHKVELSAFCLDRTEVTVAAYDECVRESECVKAPDDVEYVGVTPEKKEMYSPLCNARKDDRAQHPINCVDWQMASTYCAFRGKRLPTEAQWEYAARGGVQRDFPWGDEKPDETRLNACGAECSQWGEDHDDDMKSMYEGDDGHAATAPVGSFPAGASARGVVDLAGNVWEWTADWYAPYEPDEQRDPAGPTSGTNRVVRGGAFNGWMEEWAKPSYRWKSRPSTYNHGIGFRCAADPSSPEE